MGSCCSGESGGGGQEAAEALRRSIEDTAVVKVPTFEWRFRDGHGGSKLGKLGAVPVRKGLEARGGKAAPPLVLELLDMALGDEGAEEVAAGLGAPGLRVCSLNLSSNGITSRGATALARCVRPDLELTRLVLGRNDIDADGLADLVQALAAARPSSAPMEHLEIPMGDHVPRPVVHEEHRAIAALQELVASSVARMTIRLWGSGVGEDAAACVVDSVGDQCKEFRMLGSKTCFGALGQLKSAARFCVTLNVLELKFIFIPAAVLEVLCDALAQQGCGVSELCLFNCNIDDQGCGAIGRMIAKNSSVKTLDIGGNEPVTSQGLAVLFEGLRRNRRLRTLNMTELDFTDGAAETFVRCLEDPSSAPLTNVRHKAIQNSRLAERLIDVLNRNECRDDETSSASSLGVAAVHSPAAGAGQVVAGDSYHGDDSFELVV